MRVQTSADYSTIESISERLIEASDALGKMTERVAKARQIKDYDSDRRKRALACCVTPLLAGNSAASAEHQARASESYGELLESRGSELAGAEEVIAEWEAAKIKWETARSLLSVQKSLVANL